MQAQTLRTLQALRDFALVATAATLAAVSMATGLPADEEGTLLDAELWHSAVTQPSAPVLAKDGWYRLVPANEGVRVDAVSPRAVPASVDASDALYFRQAGTKLKTGWRAVPRTAEVLRDAKPGTQYEMTYGRVRYSVRIESTAKGMAYEITQGGRTATYVLAPFDAETSSIRFVADLDGDGLPDFLVDVGDRATYLLLSSRAQSGASRPAAELWASGL